MSSFSGGGYPLGGRAVVVVILGAGVLAGSGQSVIRMVSHEYGTIRGEACASLVSSCFELSVA